MTWFHRYERFRDKGICYRCKGKARKGMVLCQDCADKKAARERDRRAGAPKPKPAPASNPKWKTGKDLRSVRRRKGLCTRCGAKAMKDRGLCQRCRERKNAQQRAMDAIRRERGEVPRTYLSGRDEWAESARPADKVADEMHALAVKLAAGKLPW